MSCAHSGGTRFSRKYAAWRTKVPRRMGDRLSVVGYSWIKTGLDIEPFLVQRSRIGGTWLRCGRRRDARFIQSAWIRHAGAELGCEFLGRFRDLQGFQESFDQRFVFGSGGVAGGGIAFLAQALEVGGSDLQGVE